MGFGKVGNTHPVEKKNVEFSNLCKYNTDLFLQLSVRNMPRKKSNNAKRRAKLKKASDGNNNNNLNSTKNNVIIVKLNKKLKNIYNKFVKYMNEWNDIERSSQATFNSINNLAERLPLLRELSNATRDNNIDNKSINVFNNNVNNNNNNNDIEMSMKNMSISSDNNDSNNNNIVVADNKFGVLNEFPNIGIKLLTRHMQEIERNWRNLRVELDGFHSSTKKMQLIMLQAHDLLTSIPYDPAEEEDEDNVRDDDDVDAANINHHAVKHVTILEQMIQMFVEEYWRKYDIIQQNTCFNDNKDQYTKETFQQLGMDFHGGSTSSYSCIRWNYIDMTLSTILYNKLI